MQVARQRLRPLNPRDSSAGERTAGAPSIGRRQPNQSVDRDPLAPCCAGKGHGTRPVGTRKEEFVDFGCRVVRISVY